MAEYAYHSRRIGFGWIEYRPRVNVQNQHFFAQFLKCWWAREVEFPIVGKKTRSVDRMYCRLERNV